MTTRGWVNTCIVIIVIMLVVIFIKKYHNVGPDVIAAKDSTQYYKNKMNQEVAAIKQSDADFYRVQEKGYLEKIAKLFNSKATLLKEITVLQQKGQVVIKANNPPIIKYDTLPGEDCPTFRYVSQVFTNPYYYSEVHISTIDSSIMYLETYDTLTHVVKRVKEGGLFNRRLYLEINELNSNPFNHVTNLQSYRQPFPKQKRIGIGPLIGVGFGGSSLKPIPFFGIGIQYNIISL